MAHVLRLTWDFLLLCQQHGITLSVRHIPGHLNILAHRLLKRNQIIGTKWSLHPGIVPQTFSIWYILELDLFAAQHNHKLPAFVSQVPDPKAVAVGALSNPWHGQWVDAYPPTALMQWVLYKFAHSDHCRLLLVAPLQLYLSWLPTLLALLVASPWKISRFHYCWDNLNQ